MRVGQAVRSLGREELAALIMHRPELAASVDLDDLARRASWHQSVAQAAEELGIAGWTVLQLLCLAPDGARRADLVALGPAPAELVDAGVEELRRLVLCELVGDRIHLHGMLRERMQRPLRLGPPLRTLLGVLGFAELGRVSDTLGLPRQRSKADLAAGIAADLARPGRIGGLLAAAPAGALAALHAADRRGGIDGDELDDADVGWLVLHALLVPVGWPPTELAMPREVGRALRGGRLLEPPEPPPPVVARTPRGAVAAGAAIALTQRVAALLELLRAEPAPLRKDDALGVRELRRIAEALDETEASAAWLVELAAVAGFLWRGGRRDAGVVTVAADAEPWLAKDAVERWADIVGSCLASSRPTHLAGRRRGGRLVLATLGDRYSPDDASRFRLDVVTLASDPGGLDADPAAVAAALAWFRPARWADVQPLEVSWYVEELEALGVLVDGTVAPGFAALAAEGVAAARLAIDAEAGSGVGRFTMQADGTIVLAGVADPRVEARVAAIADVESRGHATVYRLSEASVRRGLDDGLSGADVLGFLAEHATHGVPQPVAVLVADAERRSRELVLGACRAYLRVDDPALAEQLLRTRKLGKLALRRAGAGVLVADAEPKELAAALRDAGFLPALERAPGVATTPKAATARSRRRPTGSPIAYFEPQRPVLPADPLALVDRLLRGSR